MNARQLRHAVAAQDNLRALWADLDSEGQPLLAAIVRNCGEAIELVTTVIVSGHVETPRTNEEMS